MPRDKDSDRMSAPKSIDVGVSVGMQVPAPAYPLSPALNPLHPFEFPAFTQYHAVSIFVERTKRCVRRLVFSRERSQIAEPR